MGDFFRDADTGELIPAEAVDPSQYDLVYDATQPESGWAETAGRSAVGGLFGFGGAAAGLGREAQDVLGAIEKDHPWLGRIAANAIGGFPIEALNQFDPNFFADAQQQADQLIQDQRKALNVPSDSYKKPAFDIASSVLPDVGILAGSALTGGGVIPAAATMGLKYAGQKYGQLRDSGASILQAATGSTLGGVGTAAFNVLPVERALSEGGTLLTRALQTGAINAPLGAVGSMADLGISDAFSPQDFTPAQYGQAAAQGAEFGAAAGTAFGVVGSLGRSHPNETMPSPELASAFDSQVPPPPELPPSPPALPEPQRALPAPMEQAPAKAPKIDVTDSAKTFAEPITKAAAQSEPINIQAPTGLSPRELVVNAAATERLKASPKSFVDNYIARNTKDGTLIIDTDLAREQFPEYAASKQSRSENAAAVHEPASAIANKAYEEGLKAPPNKGKVLFTAGGGGSGKSTARESPALQDITRKSDIVYDTTLGNLSSATKKIQAALDSGRQVTIAYIDTPIEVAAARSWDRALKEGRTVSAERLATDHYNSARNFLQLYNKLAGSKDVAFRVISNFPETQQVSIANLARRVYNENGGNALAVHKARALSASEKAYETTKQQTGDSAGLERLRRIVSGKSDSRPIGIGMEGARAGPRLPEDIRRNGGEPPSSESGTPKETTAQVGSRLESERGSTSIPGDIASGAKNVLDELKALFTEDPNYKDIPESERVQTGLRGFIGKGYKNPSETAAKAGENGKLGFNAMYEAFKKVPEALNDFKAKLDPYLNLPDRSRVDALLREQRRFFRRQLNDIYAARDAVDKMRESGLEPTPDMVAKAARKLPQFTDSQFAEIASRAPEFQKKPITPDELAAIRSVRTTMDSALDYVERALKAKAENMPEQARLEYEDAVKQYVDALREQQYVPFSRFGDHYVVGLDSEGNVQYRKHFDSKSQALRARAELEKTGQFSKVEAGAVDARVSKEFAGLHPDTNPFSKEFNPEQFTQQVKAGRGGFVRHLARAALTAGEEENLSRSLADYLSGLARFHAVQTEQPKFNAAMSALRKEGKPISAQELTNAWHDWQSPSGKAVRTVNQLVNAWYLAATPASAIANATQTPLRTIPSIIREAGTRGPAIASRATSLTFNALKDIARGRTPLAFDAELSAAFKKNMARGGLGTSLLQEFSRTAQGLEKESGLNKAMYGMFQYAETANRTYGFIAGYEIARSRGLSGSEAYNFAERFNDQNNIIQADIERPALLRSKFGKLTMQYKNYQIQLIKTWLSDVGRGFRGDTRSAAAAASTLAAYVAIGGVSAGLGATALRALSAAGINVPDEVQKKTGAWADIVNYGPLSPLLNLSPAVSTQELIPDIYNDPYKALVTGATGAAGNFLFNSVPKAIQTYQKYDNPRLAAEAIAPRVVRNLSKLERWYSQNGLRDYRNQILVDRPPSGLEAAQMIIGSAPLSMTHEYQKRATEQSVGQQAAGVDNLNFKIAKSIFENDDAKKAALIAEAAAKGQKVDASQVKNYLIAMESKQGADYLKLKQTPKKNRSAVADVQERYR